MKRLTIITLVLSMFTMHACDIFGLNNQNNNKKDNNLNNYSGEIVEEWNEVAYESTIPLNHPLLIVRGITMMHLAMHDAVNSIDMQYEYYAYHEEETNADPQAAISTAAYYVLSQSFPDNDSLYSAYYDQNLAMIADGEAKQLGIEVGKKSAEAILSLRSNDGVYSNPISQVEPSDVPGEYQTVPPRDFLYAKGWETLQPFTLTTADQFRNEPPPALDSEIYATHLNEVEKIGALENSGRTADESESVLFWYEYSELGWNRIARRTVNAENLSLWETARIYALLNMGLMDAHISGWDGKNYFNFWRPYTAIRRAEIDGNELTQPNPGWEPFYDTPAAQDYPSTHSALGNAAATILTELVGENVSFPTVSTTFGDLKTARTFTSFYEAADENAESRILGGFHFRFSCDAGQELGNKVGKWATEYFLRPVNKSS